MLAHLKRHMLQQFFGLVERKDDGKMDAKEFTQVVKHLTAWGVEINAAKAFKSIDDTRDFEWRGTGVLTLDEIMPYLRKLKKDTDDVKLSLVKSGSTGVLGGGRRPIGQSTKPKHDTTASLDLHSIIAQLPTSKYYSREDEARKKMCAPPANRLTARAHCSRSCRAAFPPSSLSAEGTLV